MQIHTFFDFCSGIGGGRLGLEQAGLRCVGRSETSRLADITYCTMHNTDNELNYGNLKKITGKKIPKYDLLIAGFPCQTFSVIGRQEGFSDDRGQIIFHLSRILKETSPTCFILENVKGLVTHDNGKTIKIILKELSNVGYTVSYRVLTSLDYGVPQMRQRVYFVGFKTSLGLDYSKFEWPQSVTAPPLSNFLIDDNAADDERLEILKHYLNNQTNNGKYSIDDLRQMEGKIIDTRMNDLRIYTGKCPTLRAQRDGVLYVRNGIIYQLTGFEALLLQGFPQKYAEKVKGNVTDRHLLMQSGNAMTVNVIKALGESIINFLKSQEVNTMRPGEQFENDCYEYLKQTYNGTTFHLEGGMDSTKSDIAVIKNNHINFYIEAKDTAAQSGQFVLLPNEETETFVFSPKNHSEPNEMTEIMIQYMNNDFHRFNNAGTAGESLDIDSSVFSDWIIDHYIDRNVKYVISYKNDFVILPIRKFSSYFEVLAKYRIKKSGSGYPAKKDFINVENEIMTLYPSATVEIHNSKLFVTLDEPLYQDRFEIGKYTYYFSRIDANTYKITRLSNTYNMNVIFSIRLKREQDIQDLLEFESDLEN